MSITNIEQRQEVERKVVSHLVKSMQEAGWNVSSVNDGEELVKCSTEQEVIDNVFACEESWINFRKPCAVKIMQRCVQVVLGNDGWDCLADHSLSQMAYPEDDFEQVMDDKVYPFCESLAN